MRARVTLATIALAIVAVAFFCVHARAAGARDGPVFRDFEAYYAGGATWRYGGDPYSRDVWRTERTIPDVLATRDELLPFVGPPYALPFWAALARLAWPSASFCWGAMLVASLAALVTAGVRLGAVAGARALPASEIFGALVFAATFAPLTSGIALGQVAIVSCAAIACVPFALRGRRTIAKTLVAALVAAAQPTTALVLVARLGNVRSMVAIAGAGLAVVAGSQLALAQYGGLAAYAHVLAEHAAAERAIAIQTSVGAVLRGLGASPGLAELGAIVVALATIVVLTVQCASRRYAPDDRLLLASAAVPLVWPFAHEHDFAIAFVPALVVAARARGGAWLLGAFASLAIGADWLGLAQRPSGAAFEALRALAGAFALAALATRDTFDLRRLAPALTGGAVLVAGAFAAAHPLNVWPDALPHDFHVPRAFDAAHTWAAEQIRSGVADFNQTNAALRAIPLVGCAALWLAASRSLGHCDATARPTPPGPVALQQTRVRA